MKIDSCKSGNVAQIYREPTKKKDGRNPTPVNDASMFECIGTTELTLNKIRDLSPSFFRFGNEVK